MCQDLQGSGYSTDIIMGACICIMNRSDKQFKMELDEECSRIVSQSLDCLGYSQDMVKHRAHMWDEESKHQNLVPSDERYTVYAGSKAEGLSAPFGSDLDVMFVSNDIVCTDDIQHLINTRNMTVFQTDRRESPPGYTKLKLVHFGGRSRRDLIQVSLFECESNDQYLSSDIYLKTVTQDNIIVAEQHNGKVTVEDPSGPSTPITGGGIFKFDFVESFCCSCPELLHAWITRPRQYGWPTPELLRDISEMEAHVVPVGYKRSENCYEEWRICFTRAEIHLIRNFNDTQTKLYVLLKMVAKSIIKPVCDDITSYIMKNIVLWMSEDYPQELFREELLTQRLVQSLNFLKHCVEDNHLPNYMIPERNLLVERLDSTKRQQLLAVLSDSIQAGGRLLLRCERLTETMRQMYESPGDVVAGGRMRDRVERLWLLRRCMRMAHMRPGMSWKELFRSSKKDDTYCEVHNTLIKLVLPEWAVLELQGIDREPICTQRMTKILS